jgi:hypothetical protein
MEYAQGVGSEKAGDGSSVSVPEEEDTLSWNAVSTCTPGLLHSQNTHTQQNKAQGNKTYIHTESN